MSTEAGTAPQAGSQSLEIATNLPASTAAASEPEPTDPTTTAGTADSPVPDPATPATPATPEKGRTLSHQASTGPDSNLELGKHEVDEDLLRKLWIASTITKYPVPVWCCVFVCMILLGVLDGLVFELSANENRAFLVTSDPYVENLDAFNLASEDTVSSEENTDALPQTETSVLIDVHMMFQLRNYGQKIDTNDPNATDYWILTPENLQTIQKYEDMVVEDDEWNTRFCYVSDTDTYQCDYYSIARDVSEHFGWDYSTMNTADIKAYVRELYEDEPSFVSPAFNGEYGETGQTYIYRSLLTGGLPFARDNGTYENGTVVKTSEWSNLNDDFEAQEDDFNDWAVDIWVDITVDHNANLKDGNLKVVTLIYSVYRDYFNVILISGMSYIVYAVVFVLVWMTVHLQSLFLSFFSIFQIMLSFPFAYFVYYYIVGVTYYDNLSLLIVFVLLGVGADDVFVFTDAWRQSLHFVKDRDDVEQRMTFAYRRASKAMLVTQVTTFFAFLATAFSLIMPISAFGIWAATIVACNYLLVITMYPALLLIHHRWVLPLEKQYCCRCCHRPKGMNQSVEKAAIGSKIQMAASIKNSKETTGAAGTAAGGDTPATPDANASNVTIERAAFIEEQAEEYRALEKFFGVTWTFYVTKFRFPILIFFAILFGLAMWQATGIQAQDEAEQWFNDDHYMQQAVDFSNQFSTSESDGLVELNIVWGLSGVNRDSADPWDVSKLGKLKYDDNFDMSSPEAQQFLKDACTNLSNSDFVFSASTVTCPMDDVESFALSRGDSFPWVYDYDTTYDADMQKEEFAYFMLAFTQSSYSYVLRSSNLIYVSNSTSSGVPEIKYIALYAATSTDFRAASSELQDTRSDWDTYLKETFWNNEECPDSVCDPINASFRWAWIRTMQEFVRSAIQGILIAMPLAFAVLLISTRNWRMACFATLDILGIMACELAIMSLQGWKFGVSESVAIVIIIGFSVDYVVHFANAYLESTSPLRGERLSFSLLTMGISVASGAITTFLAGFMLLFPETIFFQKMGLLIITTIIFSLLWALCFFVALLSQFGPEHDQGHIPVEKWIANCKTYCKKE